MSKLRTAAVLSLSTSAGVKAHNDPHKSRLKLRGRTLRNFISERSVDDSKQNSLQSSLERELQTGTECENNKWHPDDKTADGCSNSLEYPAEWEGVDALFFRNAQDCCQFFLPDKDCQIYNVCGGTTQTPSDESPVATSSCMWHPDVVNKDGCSNSPDVPIEWKSDAVYDSYNFASSEECCDKFFGTKPCVVHDECKEGTAPLSSPSTSNESPVAPSSSCNNNKWHPDDVNKDGCTNSPDFPQEWLREPSMFFYDTVEGCCDFFFSNCKIYDICVEEKPALTSSTPKPSLTPTRKSQPTPGDTTPAGSSANPTSVPSEQPTTGKPTNSLTPKPTCNSALWHPSEDFSKCTNGFGYNEIWDSFPMNKIYMHETPSGCCEEFFEQWNNACVVDDVCDTISLDNPGVTSIPTKGPLAANVLTNQLVETQSPLSSPAPVPSSKPTSKPSTYTLLKCDSALWHPSEDLSKCSNSFGYPETWNDPAMSFAYLHDTAGGCCEVFFFSRGKECIIEDICTASKVQTQHPSSQPTPEPTKSPEKPHVPPCDSAKWHPSEDRTKCTNSLDYPENWNKPSLSNVYLHDTADSCCMLFFFSLGKPCVVNNFCTLSLSGKPSTQPTSDPTKSSLGIELNSSPTGERIAPTQSPTIFPTTSTPSQAPSHSELSPPTNAVMLRATSGPSSHTQSVQLYSIPSSGLCAHVDKDTPSWITTFYTDWTKCCKVSWVFDACMAGAPVKVATTTTPSTMSASSTTSIVQYYSIPSTGMCATVDKDTPSWITSFYSDWTECCKVGWVFEKCLAAAPA